MCPNRWRCGVIREPGEDVEADLVADFKRLRLYGMATCYAEGLAALHDPDDSKLGRRNPHRPVYCPD
jgi:hypothetical protein